MFLLRLTAFRLLNSHVIEKLKTKFCSLLQFIRIVVGTFRYRILVDGIGV